MIVYALLLLLAVCALSICVSRNLFAIAVLMGVYSFILALLWAGWGALDVSFTEAMVSSGVGTILLITLLWSTQHAYEARPLERRDALITALALLLFCGGMVFIIDMPAFGDLLAPAHAHVAPDYVRNALHDTHTPNVVTAVLADYRGFDTLMETMVIFTAGMACWLAGSDRA